MLGRIRARAVRVERCWSEGHLPAALYLINSLCRDLYRIGALHLYLACMHGYVCVCLCAFVRVRVCLVMVLVRALSRGAVFACACMIMREERLGSLQTRVARQTW